MSPEFKVTDPFENEWLDHQQDLANSWLCDNIQEEDDNDNDQA